MDTGRSFNHRAGPGESKRTERRHRTFKAGMVVINNQSSTISCVIKNLSSRGARLKIDGLFRPPRDFNIMVPTENWRAKCQVVWRKGDELGIRFLADRSPLKHAGGRSQVIGQI